MIFIKKIFFGFLFIGGFSSNALAETGYVFEADLNKDGIADTIRSGPYMLFGNSGGPFVLTLSVKNRVPTKQEISLNPSFVSVERLSDAIKIWTYWHVSSSEGRIAIYNATSSKNFLNTFTVNYGDSGTESGNVLLKTIFSKKFKINFKKVYEYTPPPRPNGLDWGK